MKHRLSQLPVSCRQERRLFYGKKNRRRIYHRSIIRTLARKTSGESTVRLDENGEKIIDTISIRNGLSDILERMHNGETMDSIFADISDGRYKDTREFCEKCLESEGPNEEVLTFMADVLNYVNSLKDENGGSVPASILRPFTENIFDLIDETQSASTDI